MLQSAGYATGHFGKWHLNGKNGDRNTKTPPGRAILAADPLSPGKLGFDEWVSADNFFDLDPVLGRNGVPEKFHGDGSDIVTDEALKFIREQARARQAVPRGGLVRQPARAARSAAGGQSGLTPRCRRRTRTTTANSPASTATSASCAPPCAS